MDNNGGAEYLSQDEIGDVAGVVAAVVTDAAEETRLPNDNHEPVREGDTLLPPELMLALGAADAAEHAAHDVN